MGDARVSGLPDPELVTVDKIRRQRVPRLDGAGEDTIVVLRDRNFGLKVYVNRRGFDFGRTACVQVAGVPGRNTPLVLKRLSHAEPTKPTGMRRTLWDAYGYTLNGPTASSPSSSSGGPSNDITTPKFAAQENAFSALLPGLRADGLPGLRTFDGVGQANKTYLPLNPKERDLLGCRESLRALASHESAAPEICAQAKQCKLGLSLAVLELSGTLAALHDGAKKVHGDVAARNVLIETDAAGHVRLLLSDAGGMRARFNKARVDRAGRDMTKLASTCQELLQPSEDGAIDAPDVLASTVHKMFCEGGLPQALGDVLARLNAGTLSASALCHELSQLRQQEDAQAATAALHAWWQTEKREKQDEIDDRFASVLVALRADSR